MCCWSDSFCFFGGGHRPDEEEEEEAVIGWQEKLFSQVSQYYLSSVSLHPPDSHLAGDSCRRTDFQERLWRFILSLVVFIWIL